MKKETPQSIGKSVHLGRILKKGKAVIFAFDHGFEHGPSDFPSDRVDPREVIRLAVRSKFDAIMVNKGIAETTWDLWAGKVPLILKVTGKTSLKPPENQLLQYRTSSVEDAIALAADGVAGTIYWGAPQEGEMVERLADIIKSCDANGLPSLILAYPRGSSIKDHSDPAVVRYAVRASSELGVDMIKTHYTGSTESFREVVNISNVPVLMSGGTKTDPSDFLNEVKSVMNAGAAGVVVGRNAFQSKNFVKLSGAIKRIVHLGIEPKEAMESMGDGEL
jgi:class I fructose-bisphosphate aldolase